MMSKLGNLSSERLPHDIVIDILTRLLVKSLIRFRCVSKSWYSTITDPIFITKHLNLNNKAKSLSSNNNHNGFLLYTDDKQLYTAACNGGPTLTLTEVSEFQIPFPVDHYMVDHCNGMSLIYGNRDALIYLWNPNIQKFKVLADGPNGFTLGLAYHCQNNDFKILKIVLNSIFNNNTRPRFEAKVYTLGTDLWRRIEFSVESVPYLGSILDIQYDPESLYENNIGIPSPNWLSYTTDLMESLVLLDHK